MKRYTKQQKRAFYAGMGYRFGKEGKKMGVRSENMTSFTNGYKRAKNASAAAAKAEWAKKKSSTKKKTETKKK